MKKTEKGKGAQKSNMLEIKNLHSGYGKLEILKGVNIEVRKKEIVAVIGPNGAGKSTVIKSVFNIAKVINGEIIFKGKNIRGLKTHELLGVGIVYVPQGRIIFGNLTINENLKMASDFIDDPKEADKMLEIVYKQFSILKERENHLAYTLRGGERQMLALGRALMNKPELLMLDEPSLGLAPKLQRELFQNIKKLRDNAGISILIIEQNAKKAIEISDRVYLLEDGKVALHGGKNILENKKIKSVYLGGRY